MRKTLLIILLLSTTIIFYSCNKKSDDESPVSISSVDINSLSNTKILNIIYDKNLNEGIYQITTDNNTYILFKGIKNEYTDINSELEDETLIINCNTSIASKNTNKLYVIRERNTTSSENKSVFFHTIIMKVNNKEGPFNSIFKI